MGKLHHLPGSALSPQVVLSKALEEIGNIKSVAVIVQWDDDSFSSDWSRQKISELCMGSMAHDFHVRKVMTGSIDEE